MQRLSICARHGWTRGQWDALDYDEQEEQRAFDLRRQWDVADLMDALVGAGGDDSKLSPEAWATLMARTLS